MKRRHTYVHTAQSERFNNSDREEGSTMLIDRSVLSQEISRNLERKLSSLTEPRDNHERMPFIWCEGLVGWVLDSQAPEWLFKPVHRDNPEMGAAIDAVVECIRPHVGLLDDHDRIRLNALLDIRQKINR